MNHYNPTPREFYFIYFIWAMQLCSTCRIYFVFCFCFVCTDIEKILYYVITLIIYMSFFFFFKYNTWTTCQKLEFWRYHYRLYSARASVVCRLTGMFQIWVYKFDQSGANISNCFELKHNYWFVIFVSQFNRKSCLQSIVPVGLKSIRGTSRIQENPSRGKNWMDGRLLIYL